MNGMFLCLVDINAAALGVACQVCPSTEVVFSIICSDQCINCYVLELLNFFGVDV